MILCSSIITSVSYFNKEEHKAQFLESTRVLIIPKDNLVTTQKQGYQAINETQGDE